MLVKYRAVLFDFDLTLIDASPAILACYKHTLTKMGCTPPDDEVIRRTIGLTVEDSLEQMSGCHDKARIAEYREVYRIKADELMVPGTSLLPHTLDTIRRLRAAGCKLGIVTSKNHARTLLSLDKFQLAGSFDVIVGFEDIDRPKPDPQGLNKAIAMLGLSKEQVLYVGDSYVDARTAKAAGVDSVGVLTGTTTRAQMEEYPHLLIADHLGQMTDWLGV